MSERLVNLDIMLNNKRPMACLSEDANAERTKKRQLTSRSVVRNVTNHANSSRIEGVEESLSAQKSLTVTAMNKNDNGRKELEKFLPVLENHQTANIVHEHDPKQRQQDFDKALENLPPARGFNLSSFMRSRFDPGGDLTDMKVSCGPFLWKVHKLILCIQSPLILDAVLKSPAYQFQLDLEDAEPATVACLVYAMYGRDLTEATTRLTGNRDIGIAHFKEGVNVLKLAISLQLKGVTMVAVAHLARTLVIMLETTVLDYDGAMEFLCQLDELNNVATEDAKELVTEALVRSERSTGCSNLHETNLVRGGALSKLAFEAFQLLNKNSKKHKCAKCREYKANSIPKHCLMCRAESGDLLGA